MREGGKGEKFCIYKDVQYPMQTLEFFSLFISFNQSIGGSLLDGSRSFQFSFGGKGSQIPIRSLQIASELDHISDLDQFTSSIFLFYNPSVKTE